MAKGMLIVGPYTSAWAIIQALRDGRIVKTDRTDGPRWRQVKAKLGEKLIDFSDKRRRFYHVTLRKV